MKVLFLPHPAGERLFEPWGRDVIDAVGTGHDLAVFDATRPLAEQFGGIDVVIDSGGAAGTREMADAAASVQLWQILGTGFDHFDLDYWRAKGIPVANCPGALSAVALADCAMMLILMLARRYPTAAANLSSGLFYEPVGTELERLQLCIVGFGASGRELARRARAFGMRLAVIDVREVGAEEREELGVEWVGGPARLDEAVAAADVVSLHLHLDETTRHLLDARRLALMKPSAFLVNVSRGELVDEEALARALAQGRLAGAGLDVFSAEPLDPESPLLFMPSVVATPHIAGVTYGTSLRRAQAAAENVDRIAAGLDPLYRID